MLFYRNLLGAALELAPDETMRAITDVVSTFQMPGSTIADFTRKSVQIAMAGIYDLRIHHDDVLRPVLRHWKVWDVEGLGAEGEQARTELDAFLADLDATAGRFEAKRAAHREKQAARGRVEVIVT
jgi:acyl-[acyl-carrier-protein] desaturase